MERICKKCLLREMAEEDYQKIEAYQAAIRAPERAEEDEYERRLAICKKCERLNAGTCGACGCYVELRALAKTGKCPLKLWERQRITKGNEGF